MTVILHGVPIQMRKIFKRKKPRAERPSARIYLKLFTSTFYISAFTFGGGFVIVPLLRDRFVNRLKWLEDKEMVDLITVAQLTPGAITVNTSVLIGYRVGGVIGAVISVVGTILPPLVTISFISFFYDAFRQNKFISAILQGMQAGVAAVIVDVVINMTKPIVKNREIFSLIIMLLAFVAVFFYGVNVFYVIIVAGLLGVIRALYEKRRERRV